LISLGFEKFPIDDEDVESGGEEDDLDEDTNGDDSGGVKDGEDDFDIMCRFSSSSSCS
jgi:hypothetical protein